MLFETKDKVFFLLTASLLSVILFSFFLKEKYRYTKEINKIKNGLNQRKKVDFFIGGLYKT